MHLQQEEENEDNFHILAWPLRRGDMPSASLSPRDHHKAVFSKWKKSTSSRGTHLYVRRVCNARQVCSSRSAVNFVDSALYIGTRSCRKGRNGTFSLPARRHHVLHTMRVRYRLSAGERSLGRLLRMLGVPAICCSQVKARCVLIRAESGMTSFRAPPPSHVDNGRSTRAL